MWIVVREKDGEVKGRFDRFSEADRYRNACEYNEQCFYNVVEEEDEDGNCCGI